MNFPIHLRYRPQVFSEMVGQRLTSTVLDNMTKAGKVPSGLLFTGPSGTGKTTAARILGRALAGDVDPSLCVTEIDAASHGGVAHVRDLIENLRYSTGSAWRVVILDEAHSMSRDAFNALLKTLEEPPAGVVFVLVTTEAHKVPETVASRLMEFEFRRVTPEDIFDRLVAVATAEKIELPLDVLQRIAVDASGSVRKALMLLEQADLADLRDLETYLRATALRDISGRILVALADGDHARVQEVIRVALSSISPQTLTAQIVATLRDVLVLRSGGNVQASGKALDDRHALMAVLEDARLFAALRILWDVGVKTSIVDDPKVALDLALGLIGEIFTRGREERQKAPTPASSVPVRSVQEPVREEPKRLSLSELEI